MTKLVLITDTMGFMPGTVIDSDFGEGSIPDGAPALFLELPNPTLEAAIPNAIKMGQKYGFRAAQNVMMSAFMNLYFQPFVTTPGVLSGIVAMTDGSFPFMGNLNVDSNKVSDVGYPSSALDLEPYGQHRFVEDADTLVTTYDKFIGYDSITAPRVVTLPAAPNTGHELTVKDAANGLSLAITLTINGNGKKIDGQNTKVMNVASSSLRIYYNGTSWSVIG